MATLGKVETTAGDGSHEHTFTIEDNNAHPSLTVTTVDPVGQWHYPLTVVNSLGLNAEAGGDVKITAGMKGKKQAQAQGVEAQYSDEEAFAVTDMKVMLGDTLEGLDMAEKICVQTFDMTITKESEDINCISSKDPVDFMDKSITIEGSMEMYRTDDTYKDIAFNDIAKSMRVSIVNQGVDLGGAHPELVIDLAKVKFTDWSEAVALNDLIKQTVSFKAHYSIKDKKAIEVVLVNTQESY